MEGRKESIEQGISTVSTVSNVTSGVTYVSACAAVLPVVYAAYTVDFRRSTHILLHVNHITFSAVVTDSRV